jgi:SPP1 gp7 family putative phage head morphogenesis protein
MIINKISPEKISSADKYPTRQQGNIRLAALEIKRRMRQAREEVLQLIDTIPVKSIEVSRLQANDVSYVYELSGTRFLEVELELRNIIAKWLEVQDQTGKPARWFFDPYVTKAYTDGTALSAGNIAAALESAGADPILLSQMQLETIMFSQPYRRRFELVLSRTFNDMAGFADDNGRELGQILASGVAGGQSPRTLAKQIEREFDFVEGYRALRIARTELNTAFNVAREEQTKDARDRLGVEVKVMHISSLLEGRTRPHHAERNGSLHTPEAQALWWSDGTNRINCYCTTVEIVFIDGEPLQVELIKRVRAKGAKFLGIDKQWPDGIQPDKKAAE